MPEEQLVGFLKDARLLVTQHNQFIMSDKGSNFHSQGHTQFFLIKCRKKHKNINTDVLYNSDTLLFDVRLLFRTFHHKSC